MDVLRSLRYLTIASVSCMILGSSAIAGPYDVPDPNAKLIQEAEKSLCHSTPEYIKTLKFLRETKLFTFHEDASRKIADQVSKGCDGAAERFSQVLVLLKTVGMSDRKSLEMALEFSAAPPDVQKNFLEIFTKTFLTEFFDYEYPKAMKIAFELSRDYKRDPAKARNDFIELVRFCKDSKKLDLSMVFCSEYSIQVARLSQFYKDGVVKPFFDIYNDLRGKKELSLDVKAALEISYNVLRNGPTAPQNFTEAYAFASKDLEMDKKAALEFAVALADRSFVGDKPPVLQFPSAPASAPSAGAQP